MSPILSIDYRYVHNKLPPTRLASLMKTMQPTTAHNETVHKLYESLQERIGTTVSEPSSSILIDNKKLDKASSLKIVPTPGPHYMQ